MSKKKLDYKFEARSKYFHARVLKNNLYSEEYKKIMLKERKIFLKEYSSIITDERPFNGLPPRAMIRTDFKTAAEAIKSCKEQFALANKNGKLF